MGKSSESDDGTIRFWGIRELIDDLLEGLTRGTKAETVTWQIKVVSRSPL